MPDEKRFSGNGSRARPVAGQGPARRSARAAAVDADAAAASVIGMEVFGTLLANGASEVYVADAQTLAILYVNGVALRNLGYSPERARSLTVFDLTPQYARADVGAVLSQLIEGGKPQVRVETAIDRKSVV